VEVKSLVPIRSGNVTFGYGDRCRIQRGGLLAVVGRDDSNLEPSADRLLVRYTSEGTQYGSNCPSGVLFFTDAKTFAEAGPAYQNRLKAELAEKATVKRLLQHEKR